MSQSSNVDQAVKDQLFTNLLAAAFAVQQWQDTIKSRVLPPQFAEIVSAALDIQGRVRQNAIHADTAMYLIANRSQKLCNAAGTAIAFLNGKNLEYKVATGISADLSGAVIPAESSKSFQLVKNGEVSEFDSWRDDELRSRVNAKSVLSSPIHREGKLIGCIQLFSRVGHFGDDAKSTCELMSAIVADLVRDIEFSLAQEVETTPENAATEAPAQDRQTGTVSTSAHAEHSSAMESGARSVSSVAVAVESDEVSADSRTVRKATGASTLTANHRAIKDKPAHGNSEFVAQVTLRASQGPEIGNDPVLKASEKSKASFPPNLGLGLLKNSNEFTQEEQHSWKRVRIVIYPFAVLLFVVVSYLSPLARGLRLEIGSMIVVAVTLLELRRRWLSRPSIQ